MLVKANIYSLDGNVKGSIEMPNVFRLQVRADLIQRAVLALQAAARQAYGTDWFAGKRTSARYLGVKGKRGSMKNREVARGTRVVGSNPGQEMRLRFAPHARGGRRGHPSKPEKCWELKINQKENTLALATAIAATAIKQMVAARGHRVADIELPIVVSTDIEAVKKSKELEPLLISLKLQAEMERVSERKVRAGRGKMRGRKYKHKVGPLFVVAEDKGIFKAAGNLPGVDVAKVNELNAEMLAPGAQPGRLTIWSEAAVKQVKERFG